MSAESKRKHVFISHHHADDAHVDQLTALLSKNGHDIRNSSIRAKPANQERLDKGLVSDETIRRLLRRKISWAGTTVVLIGKDTHKRPWVDWEINQANKQGKRIVGVYVRGGTEADVPDALRKYASSIVGWNTQRIIDAIEGKTNTFENPDGTPRKRPDRLVSTTC
jgi:hypothetical protein